MTYHHFLRLNAYGLDTGQVAGNKDGKKVSSFDEARADLLSGGRALRRISCPKLTPRHVNC